MRKMKSIIYIIFCMLLLCMSFITSGCAKNVVAAEDKFISPIIPTNAIRNYEKDVIKQNIAGMKAFVEESVYFEYNSSELSPEAMESINYKLLWLRDNNEATIVLSGYCDERGSEEYNLSLGAQRAQTVRDYMVFMGANIGKILIVSFGKGAPLELGNDEFAYSINRRVDFTIILPETITGRTNDAQ